jgi:hypothetical protein
MWLQSMKYNRLVWPRLKQHQPVGKVSTYTGQHNTEAHTETQRQTSMPQAGFEPTMPATKQPQVPAW